MKANDLIKVKGLDYAKEIISNAPESALMWNEGYSFKCGQLANTVSKEDRKKHFVKISDLKRLVESWELVESTGMGFYELKNHLNKYPQIVEFNFEDFGKKLTRAELKQAIADVESCMPIETNQVTP